jgi:hypothetical protein
MPAQLKGMVKQQLAQINALTDAKELADTVAQLQQMAGQVPPAMKPALEYLIAKTQERLEELAAAGQGGK